MKCDICNKELDRLMSVGFVVAYSADKVINREICRDCANDLETQVDMLQTFHRDKPKAEGTDE